MSTTRGPVVQADPGDAQRALQSLSSKLHLSAAALGVFSAARPEPEGVLAARGSDAARLRAWCGDIGAKDPHWREARRNGVSHATKAEAVAPVRGEHVLTAALPASLDRSRYWYLACARPAAFTPADELAAQLTLRRHQVALDHVEERDMRRLLVGRDDDLLHADPNAEAELAHTDEPARKSDRGGGLAAVMAVVRPAVAQRWGELKPGRTHDLILPLPAGPTWVRLRRHVPLAGLPGHLRLELRPTVADDPPPVGPLADDRLARAIAFLADAVAESPSLEEVAETVHVSPFHFHRLFTRAVGISPKHYLLRTQLMLAKWQLRTTHRPVSAIAAATGFASHGHFTATFHRVVGSSPTAYREREA